MRVVPCSQNAHTAHRLALFAIYYTKTKYQRTSLVNHSFRNKFNLPKSLSTSDPVLLWTGPCSSPLLQYVPKPKKSSSNYRSGNVILFWFCLLEIGGVLCLLVNFLSFSFSSLSSVSKLSEAELLWSFWSIFIHITSDPISFPFHVIYRNLFLEI